MLQADGKVGDAVTRVRAALKSACGRHEISLVALSGGLDSSIIAWHARQAGSPRGVAIIARDFVATDLAYCQMASRELDVPLEMVNVGTDEILDGITSTVKILRNFNDIEIRNSVVMYLAARWAAENGYRSIATGDGADELFAGYRFLTEMPEDRLAGELERIRNTMHFPSHDICRSLGITAVSPFIDGEVVQLAQDMESSLKVRRDHPRGAARAPEGEEGHGAVRHGKWILRRAFEDVLPAGIAWRPKSAMQDGAGTAGLTGLFESMMRIDEESYVRKVLAAKRDDGVTIRSQESMYYYEIFRREFGVPAEFQAAEAGAGAKGGGDADQPEKTCPYCRCAIARGARFCRMCAAFPV